MLKYDAKSGEWVGTTGGVDIQKLSRRQPVQRKIQVVVKPSKTDDYKSYALKLTKYIAEQMEVDLGKPVFRNIKTSCYRVQSKQIIFSYENIHKTTNDGFSEYATVGHIWRRFGYKGKKFKGGELAKIVNGKKLYYRETFWKFEMFGKQAVWAIVLHEMAHAIQDKEGYQKNGRRWDLHGQQFQRILIELITLFPYIECDF